MKNFSRTTKEQWALDFGCDISEVVNVDGDDNSEFDVRGWSSFHFAKIIIKDIKKAFVAKFNSGKGRNAIPQLPDIIDEVKVEFNKANIFSKVFYAITTPFVLVAMFVFLLVKKFFFIKPIVALIGLACKVVTVSLKEKKDFDSGRKCGCVIISEHENAMYLPPKYSDDDIEGTISHEHIHIKQKKYYWSSIALQCNNPNYFIFSSEENRKRLFYLFSPIELEARLHEVIKAIYKKNGSIPHCKSDFLNELELCSSYFLAKEHKLKEELGGNYKEKHDKPIFYDMDSERISIQLFEIFMVTASSKLLVSFASEILFPCYCNLVRYYGDEKLYQKLISEHVGPSRFDQFIASPELN